METVNAISNPLLTKVEAALLLKVSTSTIDRLMKQGKIKPVKTATKAVRFLQSELINNG